jgi:hypothetical protein
VLTDASQKAHHPDLVVVPQRRGGVEEARGSVRRPTANHPRYQEVVRNLARRVKKVSRSWPDLHVQVFKLRSREVVHGTVR